MARQGGRSWRELFGQRKVQPNGWEPQTPHRHLLDWPDRGAPPDEPERRAEPCGRTWRRGVLHC
eukprot:4409724-Pyramimonas_sp.AAC.1